jgi:hypothetical protein
MTLPICCDDTQHKEIDYDNIDHPLGCYTGIGSLTMRKLLMFFVLLFCHELVAQDPNHGIDIRAELIWVESSADDHRLMFSQLSAREWSDPLTLYASENYISSPTISTDLTHNKLIVWSEQYDNSSILMSSRRVSSDTLWLPAEKINDFKAENLGSSIVIDSLNRHWVFWSSNFEGLDDIYYSRQEGAKWSPPKRVHATNKVPDIQPIASLNQDLNVVVDWNTYDLQTGQYLTVQQVFKIDNSSKNRYKSSLSNIQEESISDVKIPVFLPRDSSVVLHFPNNQIKQSIRLYLNR